MKFGYTSVEDYVPVVNEFGEKLKQGKLIGKTCKKCNAKFFPPRGECSNCYSTEMEEFEVSPRAKLVSYTIIHFAPDSHSKLAPYIIAIGEHEGGYRTMAHLIGVTSFEQLKVGLEMELVPQELESDRIVYKYKPVS